MMSSLSAELLRQLGYALCEGRAAGEFILLYDPPLWFQEVWGHAAVGDVAPLADRSPFLEAFLSDADEHWKSGAGDPLVSGAWIECISSGREIPLEATAWRLDGKRILSIQSHHDDFQERTRVLQTARDSLLVHERLLKEIQKKEILLHCIIHDLSQPLTAMRGCFDVLARDTGTPASKRLVDLGRQQSERQDTMIREILQAFAADINSATGDGQTPQAASLLTCAQETVAAFAPVFESHGATIRLDPRIDRSAGWTIIADNSRLLRIFSNLVENALRHAPSESCVTVGLERDGSYVRAFVDDEGPGLPKEFKPSEAFALFSKGKEGGGKAGMGLYFCRITVERWGGSIGCESLPHRGARFWFRLPATSSGPSAPALSLVAAKPDPFGRVSLNILLAEDDPAIRELTKVLLEREGHEVLAVASGLEALNTIADRRFDLYVFDEEMPGMTGVEATQEIRAREKQGLTHQIIFALTGNSTEEDRTRLLAAGFDACLGKPFRAEELREAAARFSFGTTAASLKDKEAVADSSLLARVGGDAKLLRSIAQTFLRDYPAKLRKIKQAIARNDAPTLASAAHALKGAAAIFGAMDAVECARDLQQMGRQGTLTLAKAVAGKLDEAIARLDAKLREYGARASRKPSRTKRGKKPARKPRHRRAKRVRRER